MDIFYHKIVIIFFSHQFKQLIRELKKEPSHWDGSFKYAQHMFWLRIRN